MATRRIVASEKTFLEKDDHPEEKSNISPAVPRSVAPSSISSASLADLVSRHVIVKLLAFTLAMIVVPIGSYFLSVNTIFKGSIHHRQGTAL